MVHKLKCKACTEFVDRIRGSRNFSDKWIVGADSVRLSNVRDHAQNNQHLRAMSLLRPNRLVWTSFLLLLSVGLSTISLTKRERSYV